MSKLGSPSAGFTLIELLIALGIASLLMYMAVPAWQEMTAEQRVRAVTQDFYAALILARSEAIKRRQSVRIVTPIPDPPDTPSADDWSKGWAIVTVAGKTYAQCVANPTDCLNITEANRVTFTAPITTVTYQMDGRAAPGSANATFTICDNQKMATRRSVTIGLSGQPTITLTGSCQPPP